MLVVEVLYHIPYDDSFLLIMSVKHHIVCVFMYLRIPCALL